MYLLSLVLLTFLVGLIPGRVTWARTDEMKQRCDNCHTMHNSQGGNPNYNKIGRQSALLGDTCYGCHTGVNVVEAGHIHMPYVMSTSATPPTYGTTGTADGAHNTLAGGSFYWVAQGNNLKGHNVNIPNVLTPTLSCAGVNGCHGDLSVSNEVAAISQSHHAAAPKNFRMLNNIAGFEDPDYELTVSSTDHNQYKGYARTSDADPTTSSISHLCASCHASFHTSTGTYGTINPWIRHPVDFDMGALGGEFANYGVSQSGATYPKGTYNPATPLGSFDVSSVRGNVFPDAAIIVCVSCHRAHGSPYDYDLRWDYLAWPNGGYNGCGDCHTIKN